MTIDSSTINTFVENSIKLQDLTESNLIQYVSQLILFADDLRVNGTEKKNAVTLTFNTAVQLIKNEEDKIRFIEFGKYNLDNSINYLCTLLLKHNDSFYDRISSYISRIHFRSCFFVT